MELFDEENTMLQMQDAADSQASADSLTDYERDDQAYRAVLRGELLHHVGNMMSQLLEEDEKSIVERYFGIGTEVHRPARIAEDFGMSQRQVLAVVDRAVHKLRESDYAIYLYQYLHGKRI